MKGKELIEELVEVEYVAADEAFDLTRLAEVRKLKRSICALRDPSVQDCNSQISNNLKLLLNLVVKLQDDRDRLINVIEDTRATQALNHANSLHVDGWHELADELDPGTPTICHGMLPRRAAKLEIYCGDAVELFNGDSVRLDVTENFQDVEKAEDNFFRLHDRYKRAAIVSNENRPCTANTNPANVKDREWRRQEMENLWSELRIFNA